MTALRLLLLFLLPLLALPVPLPAAAAPPAPTEAATGTEAKATTQAEAEWELKRAKDGIEVYVRPVPGSRYKAFKGVAELDASLASLAAVLDHTEACPHWLHRCESGTLLEKLSATERLFHQVTDLPFPAKTRDAVFHARVDYLEGNRILIALEARPDAYPETKHIRIAQAAGSYLLEPLPKGVRVTWVQQADPGGRLPAWIVNSLLTDMPFKSLKALRQLVTQPPYKDAHFLYDDQGAPHALAY